LTVCPGLVTVSGHGGATARIYEAVNGNLIWEAHFHKSTTGHLADQGPSGVAIAFDNIDILILSNGHTVRRLAARDGAVVWGWTSPDQAYVQLNQCSARINHSPTVRPHSLPTSFAQILLFTSLDLPSPSALTRSPSSHLTPRTVR
jgi:hypothetical protein